MKHLTRLPLINNVAKEGGILFVMTLVKYNAIQNIVSSDIFDQSSYSSDIEVNHNFETGNHNQSLSIIFDHYVPYRENKFTIKIYFIIRQEDYLDPLRLQLDPSIFFNFTPFLFCV